MTQTTIQTSAPATIAPANAAAVRPSRLLPSGAEQVSVGDLSKELVRWPTMLWLPLGVAILVAVGLASPIAAVPVGLVVSTAAVFDATRRAAHRVVARHTKAVVTVLPKPRSAR